MIRALKLEWLKVRNYRVFWILTAMYTFAVVIIASIGVFFLEWLKNLGAEFDGIDPTIIPIYDFPDIWQNTTYLASFAKVLLAFIVIISINNDITYQTMRQNIIDGISKREFIFSKLLQIVALAFLSTLVLFIAGFINGSIYSHVWGAEYIFDEMEFLLAYFYDIVVYCTLAFMLALFLNKAGFAIIALFLYTMMFEPLITVNMIYNPNINDGIAPYIAQYFPIRSLNNLIPIPYSKYIFMEIEDNVPLSAVWISTGWFAIFLSLIFLKLNKKDLN
jgi:ABC-2 type transport system permease protein